MRKTYSSNKKRLPWKWSQCHITRLWVFTFTVQPSQHPLHPRAMSSDVSSHQTLPMAVTHAQSGGINCGCISDVNAAVCSLHERSRKEGKGTAFSFLVATQWSVAFKINYWFFPIFLRREKRILLRCNLEQSTRSSQRMLNTSKNISSILIIMPCLLCQLMIHYPKQLVHYKWLCTVFMELQTVNGKDGFTFLAAIFLSEYQKTEL